MPRTALGRALQDADRLEALGAIGLLRCDRDRRAHGRRRGSTTTIRGRQRRPLDDARYSVDHFFTKLLGLPATMRTAAGRAEAERRAALLRAFVSALGEELGEPAPPA